MEFLSPDISVCTYPYLTAMVFLRAMILSSQTCNIKQFLSRFFSDEKEKYDPSAFRDAIIQGLNETGADLEQVFKSIF